MWSEGQSGVASWTGVAYWSWAPDSLADGRTVVTRRVTSSTVPIAGSSRLGTERRMKSPKPYWRSVMMKKPARISRTMRWAPNPQRYGRTAAHSYSYAAERAG